MRRTAKALFLFMEADEELRRRERAALPGDLHSAYKLARAQAREGKHFHAVETLQPFHKELNKEHKQFMGRSAAQHAAGHYGNDSARIVDHLHPHRDHLDDQDRDMLDHHAHRRYEQIHNASEPEDDEDDEGPTARRIVADHQYDSLCKSLESMHPSRLALTGRRRQVNTTKGIRTIHDGPSYRTGDRQNAYDRPSVGVDVTALFGAKDRIAEVGIYHTDAGGEPHRDVGPAHIEHDFHPNGKVKSKTIEYHSAYHEGPGSGDRWRRPGDALHREGGKPARTTHHYDEDGNLTKKIEEHHLGGVLHRNEGPSRTTQLYHPNGSLRRKTDEWHLWGSKHRRGAPAHIETNHTQDGRLSSRIEDNYLHGNSVRGSDNPPDHT